MMVLGVGVCAVALTVSGRGGAAPLWGLLLGSWAAVLGLAVVIFSLVVA